jgi:hypothetical protein
VSEKVKSEFPSLSQIQALHLLRRTIVASVGGTTSSTKTFSVMFHYSTLEEEEEDDEEEEYNTLKARRKRHAVARGTAVQPVASATQMLVATSPPIRTRAGLRTSALYEPLFLLSAACCDGTLHSRHK